MRRWLEIALTVPVDAADAAANHLLELGAPGTIEEDVSDEAVRLRAHFPSERDERELASSVRDFLETLATEFPGTALGSIDVATIQEEDWAEGWRQAFPPLEIGRRLRIRPPWEKPASGRIDVSIEPAMAFGTGQHASTVGCLLALEDLLDGRGCAAVLDVGTGSGILAIAAVKLGARRALAIDEDPIAVAAAAKNVRASGVEDRVELRTATPEDIDGRFPLVVANLFANLLAGLAPRFTALAAPGAALVVAGLLDRDRDRVEQALAGSGWRVAERRSIDGWATLVARRP